MRNLILSVFLLGCSLLTAAAQQRPDYTRWVNQFIGTGGHGHTFPGATLPFGMVQLSPDTRIDNWDGSSGYHYSDDIIYGFSHTHLSGTGIPDGCDILFMPTVGKIQYAASGGDESINGYASKFSHSNEKAEPGYYSVKLDENGIFAELTATKRVGFHRYTFPGSKEANVIIDLKWRDKATDSGLERVGKTGVEGFRRSTSWAKDQTVYFVAEFSRPPIRHNATFDMTGSNERRLDGSLKQTGLVNALSFDVSDGKPILLKVAISYVSIEGARKNLEAELPHWDFDRVRADAKAAWNKELSKIEVSGGTDEQTTNFYTALYHTMIHPNVFNDVDGNYRGHDGKIHPLRKGEGEKGRRGDASGTTPSSRPTRSTRSRQGSPPLPFSPSPFREENHYTVFSLWDTFRAAHPLYTIIDQERTVDFINSFIRMYEQGGRLPVWELWGEETDTMIGYHAVSVIADAMAKGIEGFDYEKAYVAAKHSAELDHFGLASYKKRGYISSEDDNESVSKTLEYAYNDWCIAEMARIIMRRRYARLEKVTGKTPQEMNYGYMATLNDVPTFSRRARNFENVFDPETRFFRPRRNGGFIKPFAPNEVTFHFTEGNSWQYSFFVPHDVKRLSELMGGTAQFAAKLDELFTTEQKLTGREQPDITGLIGQYAHGNEPSHHIPYLYNFAGQPWKTQKYVRKIMDEFYKNAPDGLIGNEDCGQMSAWYVLSASGFYPLVPGHASYTPGAPIFTQIKYNLENGKSFIIRAPKVTSPDRYLKIAKLNGRPTGPDYLSHETIMSGGVLEFESVPIPSTAASLPIFSRDTTGFLAVPIIEGARVFKDKTEITINSLTPGAKITYTLNKRGETREYTGPFVIDETSHVEAYATDPRTNSQSMKVEAEFQKRSNDWSVKLLSTYSSQYTGGGNDAVIDGLRGTANFASGEWQGYWGKPFEAVIDLQKETDIKQLGGSFLQSARSWIWMPDRIEFEVSNDGETFRRVAGIRPGFPQQEMNPATREFVETIAPTRARYVRVRAFNFGKIPSWHLGAGGDPWIFVDEVIVK